MARPRLRSLVKLLTVNLVVLVAASGAALVGLEAYCRFALDHGMRYEFEMFKYATKLKMPSANPAISFTHRPNSRATIMGADVAINPQGLREDGLVPVPKPAGTTRILMLGDSITFGFGVPLEQTTTRLLQAGLNRAVSSRRFEVINAGVGNYNTAMEVAYYLDEGHKLDPDLVIVNYSFNDAEPTPRPRGNAITRHSYATAYITGRFDLLSRTIGLAPDWRTYYLGLYDDGRYGWAQARASLRMLKEACEATGTALTLVNYPELHELADYPLDAINQRIKDLARALSVPYLDLLPAVANEPDPSRLWVSGGDPHPNGLVTSRFAARLEEWLVDNPEVWPGVGAEPEE